MNFTECADMKKISVFRYLQNHSIKPAYSQNNVSISSNESTHLPQFMFMKKKIL
jgi:hypothetical protein